jgi:hypothetical protein
MDFVVPQFLPEESGVEIREDGLVLIVKFVWLRCNLERWTCAWIARELYRTDDELVLGLIRGAWG